MLEECVKRKESTAVFHRLQQAGSAAGLDPPSSFAYRKEFSGQLVTLLCGWVVAAWLRRHPRGWRWTGTSARPFATCSAKGFRK